MKKFYSSLHFTFLKILFLLSVLWPTVHLHAQFSFADNATNYGGAWTNGSNFGTGFNAWTITSGGANAGTYIGNPSPSGVNTANIGNNAFALFGHSAQYVNATRYFGAAGTNVPMQIGDVFSFYWGMNWDCGASGSKGFDLRADATVVFNVNNSNSAAITTTNGTADANFGTNAMLVTLTRTSWTQYTFSMTSRSGGATYTTTINSALNINNLSIYCGAQQDNNGNRNIFFNAFSFTKAAPYETNFSLTDTRILTGTSNLTKNGTGDLTLNAVSTFTGNTVVNQNFLIIGNDNNLGTAPGVATANKIQLSGGTLGFNATMTLNANRGITVNNAASTLDVFGGMTATYNGIIAGTGGLNKGGPGTLLLGGASTYTGNTTVTNGILRFGAAGVVPNASNVVMAGGTLSTGATTGFAETMGTLQLTANSTLALGTGAHNINFAASSAVGWTAGTTLTVTGWTGPNNGTGVGTAGRIFVGTTASDLSSSQLSQIVFNIGGVLYSAVQLSTGEIVASGATPLYYGGATAAWNTANWSTNNAAPYTTSWTDGRHAIFNIASTTLTGANVNFPRLTANANVTVATAGGIIGNAGVNSNMFVANGVTLDFSTQTFSGSQTFGITKNGPGTLALSGGTYGGGFTLNQGLVVARGVNAMGGNATTPGPLNINGGTIGANATRDFTGKFSAINVGGDFTLGSGTAPSAIASNLTFNAATALGASVTRTVTLGGTGVYNFNGIVSGTSSNLVLNATAAGVLALGAANTYGGNTTINGGTLRCLVANTLPGTTGVILANATGAILDLNNFNQNIASLSGGGVSGGNVTLGTGTLTCTQSSNTTYAGIISGTGGLTKSGTGTLTISGTNTFSGATTIAGGVLELGAANVFGTGNFVLSGGTLRTGSGAGFSESVGTLALTANSTIALGTGVHNLNFTASDLVAWTPATTLTITGWTGIRGASGTGGKIFFGALPTHLTATQLAQITFSGFSPGAILLSNGELVPAPATYVWNATTGLANWQLSGSWTPARTSPETTDILTFPNGGSSIATNVPTQTIAQFVMSGNTTVTLQSVAGGSVLTLLGGAGNDLDIPSGSTLIIGSGADAMGMAFTGTGHTASIAGTLNINGSNTANSYTTTNSTSTVAATGTLTVGATLAGNLVNNGLVNFTRPGNYTYAGIISGSGTLTQSGAGILSLSGTNTYTGITTINAGSTLSIGAGGNTGAISNASNVTNNGALIVNRNAAGGTYTYSGVISGSGTLTVQSSGGTFTFEVTGTNTYTGTTTISSPAIFSIGNGGATGEISNSSNIVNNSQLYINRTGTYIYGGTISGGGSINQFSGTFILTGTNTYTGNVGQGGVWSVGNGGTVGSIPLTAGFSGNGTVRFNRSDAVTYNGVITGVATLEKTGAGTLTFGGNGFYGGPTIVNQGTLQLSAANVLPSTQLTLNGGTYSTGATVGFAETLGTLSLTANSGINLGTGNHSLNFAASNAITWTAATTLTITGWTGTGGASGTNGKIFFGNTTGTLSATQLAQISFAGFPGTPILLASGELVPPNIVPVSYTWNGNTSTDWGTATNWTPNGVPGPFDHVTISAPGTNTLSINSARSITNFTVSGTGTFTTTATGTLAIGGTLTSTTSAAVNLNCQSTITITSPVNQTIPAWNFGNLDINGGARTFASSGTIGICGSFTSTTSALTTTGSTVDFNGSAAQSILSNPANFRNLTISNTTANVTASVGVTITNLLTINSSARLDMGTNALNITGATSAIAGFLRSSLVSLTPITGASATTLTFNSGGTYECNAPMAGASLATLGLPVATWNNGSVCSVIGLTSPTADTWFGAGHTQSFKNFVWNCATPGQTTSPQIGAANLTCTESFTMNSTGTGTLRLDGIISCGNFSITGGTIDCSAAAGFGQLQITGNISQTGGLVTETGTGSGIIRLLAATGLQTISQTGGSFSNTVNLQIGNGTTTNTVRLLTNLNMGAGTAASYDAQNNATLDFQNFVLSGSGNFFAASGSRLISANTNGINASTASGSVQTTLRNFTNNNISYEYNGSLAQVTGTAPAAAANIGSLVINNASNVTASVNITVNGTLTLTNGRFILGANNLTLGSAATVSGNNTSRYVQTNSTGVMNRTVNATAVVFPVGSSAYNPITFNNSGTSDVFGVRVVDATPTSPNNSNVVVNRQWLVSEVTAGGSNLSVVAQWNSPSEEAAGFATAVTPKIGMRQSGAWFESVSTQGGANPFTFTSGTNFTTFNGSAEFALGKDDAFSGPAPTITSFSPLTAYTGDVITINGNNLSGLSSITIGGVAGTILSQTGNTATVQVNAGGNGLVTATNAAGSGSSGSAFTWLGFITNANGTWSTPATWRGNIIPTPNSTVTIATGHTVSVNISSDPNNITIQNGAVLNHNTNTAVLGGVNLTAINVASGGLLTASSALTSSLRLQVGTLTLNSSATFTNNAGNAAAIAIQNLIVNNLATYNHGAAGSSADGLPSDFPGSVSRVFGNTSNCNITAWANGGITPAPLPAINFGNLTINIANAFNGNWSWNGNITTINGNFVLSNTGSALVMVSTSVNTTINVAGNFLLTGGNTFFGLTDGFADVTMNISGTSTIQGYFMLANSNGVAVLRCANHFNLSPLATLDNFSGSSPNSLLEFNGSAAQNVTFSGFVNVDPGNSTLNYRVNNPAGINLQTTALSLSTNAKLRMTAGNISNGSVVYSSNNTLVYDGNAPQTTSIEYNGATVENLEINNTGSPATVTATGNCTLGFQGTLINGLLVLGNNDLIAPFGIGGGSASSYVRTNGTGRLISILSFPPVTFPVGNSAYNPISFINAGGISDSYGVRVEDGTPPSAFNPTKVVNRYWVVTENVAGGSNLSVTAQWNSPAEEAVNFAAGVTNRFGRFDGSVWTQNGANQSGTNPKLFSTIGNFNNVGTFALGKDDAFVNPSVTYTWTGAVSSVWANSGNWSPAGIPGAIDNVVFNVVGTNPTNFNTTQTVTNLTLNGTGSLNLGALANITVNGTITYAPTASANFNCGSTFNIAGGASVTVPPVNFGNLNLTGGARVFSSTGTIGVCGTLTTGTGPFTITGSTIDFNGTGAQTVNAFNYNNLTISGNRGGGAITLPSGTIDVNGVFSPTVTNFTVLNTGNIFNYSGAAGQVVAAFSYNDLSSANFNRTLASAGTISIAGVFTPGTGTYTTTGSTVAFNGTANQNIPSFTSTTANRSYHNLVIEGTGLFTPLRNWTGTGTNGITGNMTINAGQFNQTTSAGGVIFFMDGSLNVTSANARFVQHTGALTTNQTYIQTDLNLQAGRLEFNPTSTGTGFIYLRGNLNHTGGLVSTSSVTASNGVFGFDTPLALQTLSSTTGNVFFYVNTIVGAGARTLKLLSNLTVSDGNFSVGASATLDAGSFVLAVSRSGGTRTFTLNSNATLRTSASGGVAANISLIGGATATYNSAANYEFYGNNQSTGFTTTPAITTANSISWTGTGNLNLDANIDISGATSTFNFTNNGLFLLNNFTLTLASATTLNGGPFSVNKMFVTNGTGELRRSFTGTGSFTWPLGDNTAGNDYSPATLNVTSAIGGTIGFRVIDAPHPNNAPSANFISRYWTSTTTFTSATWNGTFNYVAADINGVETAMKLNIWDPVLLGWTEFASSSAAANAFTVTTGPTQANLNNDDITARTDVPVYYRTITAGPNNWSSAASWEVSSDPTFVSPAPVPASIPPNSVNSAGILIRTGHTINNIGTVTADDLNIQTGGTLNVNAGSAFTLANGTAATDLLINGTLNVNAGTFTLASLSNTTVNGLMKMSILSPSFTSTGAIMTVNNAGIYDHNADGGSVPTATWNIGSLLRITGIGTSTSGPGGIATQTFYDVQYNCPSQSVNCSFSGSSFLNISNNLTIISTGATARDLRLFSGSTGGTSAIGGNLNVQGGILALANGGGASTATVNVNVAGNVNLSGGTLTMSGSASPNAAFVNLNVSGNMTLSGSAKLDYNLSGGGTPSNDGTFSVNLAGDLSITGTAQIVRTTALTNVPNFRFNKATGIQNYTAAVPATAISTAPCNWVVGFAGSTGELVLNNNMTINTASASSVSAGATLDCGAFVLGSSAGTSSFTLLGNSTLKMGSTAGITASAASGNIQTSSRTYATTSNYVYKGSASQVTGDGLPATVASLTIANTGGAGNNVVTLTRSGITSVSNNLNLNSGSFQIGAANTINVIAAGSLLNNGGALATTGTGGQDGGTVSFAGVGTIGGSNSTTFFNLTINAGAVNNSIVVPFINGTMRINGGNLTAPPVYNAGSTLQYNVSYGRFVEWNAVGVGTLGTTPGYPNNVLVSAGSLDVFNGANLEVRACAGNLTINAGTTLTMSTMNAPLIVGGNVSHTGTLTMSTVIGGDIQVKGDWSRVGAAAFNTNSRQVIFNGTVPQNIFGLVTFSFLRINNASGVTINNPVTVVNELDLSSGNLTLGSNNLNLISASILNGGSSSFVNTNGTGVLLRSVSATSTFFPVGRASTYAPAVLTQNGTAENMGVRVQNTIDNPVTDATKVINLQWTIAESVVGANNLTTTFQWNTSDEAVAFSRLLPIYQGHWTGTTYGIRTSSLSGSNPWISTSTQTYVDNIGAGVPFVLGNYDGLKGCFATAVSGDWNNPATWADGTVPPFDASLCVNHNLTINAVDPLNPRDVTINAGGSLSISAARKLTVNNDGFVTNNSATASLGSGTLEFAGTGTLQGTTASTLQNLTINGGLSLTTVPLINGTFTIKAGGFLTGTPVYAATSILNYNTGGPYSTGSEWTASGITAGAGLPGHVHIDGTTLTLPASARGVAGNLQILAGGLNMNGGFGADLELGGNWLRASSASFNANGNAVIFSAPAGNQTITVSGGGTETFAYLIVNKATGNLVLSNAPATNVTISGSIGSVLQLNNNGGLLINGQTLSLINNGGSISVNGPRSIGGVAGSVLSIQGSKSVIGAGTLNFGSGTDVVLLAGMDFGNNISTINGSLSVALGGFVLNNPPTYNNLSRLRYICGCAYNRGLEWSSTSGPGYPFDVEVSFNGTPTTLNLLGGGSALRQMAGSLHLLNGGTLDMGTMADPLVIMGDLNLASGSTISLSTIAGGDLQLKGNWNHTAGANFNANSREVIFNGIALQNISGPIPSLAFVKMDNPSSVQLSGTSMTINNRLWLNQGTFNHNGNSINMANASQIRRSLSSAVMTIAPTISASTSIDLRYDASMTSDVEFVSCLDCIRDLEISGGILTLSGNRTINRDLKLAGDLDLGTFTFTHRGRVPATSGSGNIEITTGNRTISGAPGCSYLINGLAGNQPGEYTKVVTNPGSGTLNFASNVLVGMGDGRVNWGAGNPVTISGTVQVLTGGSTVFNSCFYAVGSTLRFANNVDYQVNASDLTWASGAIASGLPGIPFNVEIRDNGTDLNINDVRAVRNDITITSGSSSLTLNPALPGSFNVGGNWTRNSVTSAFNHNNKKVVFDRQGAGNQSIVIGGGLTNETFFDLEVSPSSGDVWLSGGNVIVRNELRFTSGRINLNGFELTLGTTGLDGTLVGGGAATYIVSGSSTAKFTRYTTTAGSTYTFPLGAGGAYSPITVTLYPNTSVTPNSRLSTFVVPTAHPNLGTSTNYLNRYWSVDPFDFGTTTHYGVNYVYNDADVVGIEPNLKPFKFNSSGWIAATGSGAAFEMGTGTVNPGTNSIDWQGLYTFSDFTGNGNGTPLPITLLEFEAVPVLEMVELSWSTASEINNDYFSVERSLDGLNFEVIAIVDGAGNSQLLRNYSTIDANPAEGLNYYRLKQTDFDGQFSYSDIRTVNFKRSLAASSDLFSVYPNPNNGSHLNIRSGAISGDRVDVRLTDMLGKIISVHTLNMSAESTATLDLGDIQRGVYHLSLSDGIRQVVIPVVFVR